MALAAGTKLGSYEIAARIGAGGMGEVYQAHDTKLGRDVAIKVLPEAFAHDAERLSRFQREAKVLASLNHPNIATIHGLEQSGGTSYLIMELVSGETLADRVKRDGAVPIEEALAIAKQIAEALEAAHEKGIIHRDLKPANVKVTPEGKVKVLDFGLAKAFSGDTATEDMGNSPTLSMAATMQGVILGTAAYMSPEQARGKGVDKRTDIWAFGCVLYELLTGKQAFHDEDVTDILAAVVRAEPDWTALPANISPSIRVLLQRCLRKDRRQRLPDAGAMRIEIEDTLSGAVPTENVAAGHDRPVKLMAIAAVLLLTTIGLSGVVIYLYRSPGGDAAVRFFVYPPEKGMFSSGARNFHMAISPDGRRLAFAAIDASGKVLLWVRPLDDSTPQLLPGSDDGASPFWSPDSRTIAFFAQGKLKRIDANGGPVQTLADAPSGRGGTWNRAGVILFAPDINTPIYRVSSGGGEPALATKLLPLQGSHRFPSFLPDGRHFLYLVQGTGTEPFGIFLGSLDSNESQRLLAAETNALYSASGDLLFVRQGTLLRQPFDAKKLALSGDTSAVAEHVAVPITNLGAFSVSENGVLTYCTGPTVSGNFQLAWFDRTGKLVETFGTLGGYRGVDVSPDGTRIAVHRHDDNGGDIWLFESARRETMSRFTFDATQDNSSPIWSPDGNRIAFGSLRNRKWGIYQKSASGTGGEELLVESDLPTVPMGWSPDGKFIVYTLRDPKTGFDVWILPMGDKKPVPFLQSSFNERDPQISPNGKWIAYTSDETGRNEIYVRPFPTGEGKWQISSKGGFYPKWRRDGKELFYMETNASPRNVISVKVNPAGPTFEYGDPAVLFDSLYANSGHGSPYLAFAVSPDGQRFLIPRPAGRDDQGTASAPITVVLNWTAGLKK
jgi:eukaryotic-like serine/threonine-protein kinase